MKKTYLSPEISLLQGETEEMIATSIEGFNKQLDSSEENAISPDNMLSREKNSIWDDEE